MSVHFKVVAMGHYHSLNLYRFVLPDMRFVYFRLVSSVYMILWSLSTGIYQESTWNEHGGGKSDGFSEVYELKRYLRSQGQIECLLEGEKALISSWGSDTLANLPTGFIQRLNASPIFSFRARQCSFTFAAIYSLFRNKSRRDSNTLSEF